MLYIVHNIFTFYSTVAEMVQAALCPQSARQQSCVLWLRKYFQTYGDHSPNSDEVKLLIMQKTIIYKHYCEELQKKGIATVHRTQFYRLWSFLFPKCVSRPWCDIPGKCDTCYWIDELRRESRDPEVQRNLIEAHTMHRFLFMGERLA